MTATHEPETDHDDIIPPGPPLTATAAGERDDDLGRALRRELADCRRLLVAIEHEVGSGEVSARERAVCLVELIATADALGAALDRLEDSW